MADWRVARMFVLGTLVIGLGGLVYRQGFGWQLGGAPASLETAWQTEEAWIAGEIVRDITEMSAYAADRTARPDVPQPESLGGGRYKVPQVATLNAPIEVNLADGPWSPAQYVVLARPRRVRARQRTSERRRASVQGMAEAFIPRWPR